MRHLIFSSAVALSSVLLSCSSSSTGTEDSWDARHFGATIGIEHSAEHQAGGIVRSDHVSASFSTPDSTGAYAGDVLYDGKLLRISRHAIVKDNGRTGSWSYLLSSDSQAVSIPFGGAPLRIAVTGSPGVPAFSAEILSLGSELTLIAPTAPMVIRRGEDLTIAWPPSSDSRSKIDVTLLETEITDGQEYWSINSAAYAKRGADDVGTLTIAARELDAFPVGSFSILVRRTTTREGTFGAGRRYRLTAASNASMSGTIVP